MVDVASQTTHKCMVRIQVGTSFSIIGDHISKWTNSAWMEHNNMLKYKQYGNVQVTRDKVKSLRIDWSNQRQGVTIDRMKSLEIIIRERELTPYEASHEQGPTKLGSCKIYFTQIEMHVLELKWTLPFATYKLEQSSRQIFHTWSGKHIL